MDSYAQGSEEENKEAALRKEEETQKFKAADTDKNGLLDQQELPGLFYPEIHDGVLEVTARATLARKDTDKDGFLTIQEFWEDYRLAEGGSDGKGMSEELQRDFRKLDRDASGSLDLEELKARACLRSFRGIFASWTGMQVEVWTWRSSRHGSLASSTPKMPWRNLCSWLIQMATYT